MSRVLGGASNSGWRVINQLLRPHFDQGSDRRTIKIHLMSAVEDEQRVMAFNCRVDTRVPVSCTICV